VVLKAHPSEGESTPILGMVEEDLKHFSTAVRLLDSFPPLIKQHSESMDALAQSLYQLKNRHAVRQTLRGLLQVNAPPEALYLGGPICAAGSSGTPGGPKRPRASGQELEIATSSC